MGQEYLQISYDENNKIWTSTHYPYKDKVYGSLGERFLKTMRSINPNKIIDHFYDTNRQKTAKEVYEQSIIVAKNLQRLGIRKGDVVAFFCMNNEEVAVLTMGCILVGALVNYFEVFMEEEHTDYVFNLVQPTVVLYEETYKAKCLQSLERTQLKSYKYALSIDGQQQPNVKSELLTWDDDIDFDKFESVEIKDPKNELAFLALTSGSTGIPKVVQITHTLMLHGIHIWWDNKDNYQPLTEDAVLFSFSPLRWISQCAMLLESMLMGLKRISSSGAPTGKYGLELLRKCHITHVFVAPSIFYNILLELNETDVESLKSLKLILLGGEPASTILLTLGKRHCVNAKLYQCYGMTEMTSCISNDEDINGGKLLPGYQMQILDDQCRPVGPNQKGQIALKPPYPLKGYKGIDSQKYYNENGMFINGDYGVIDDQGYLHVLARYKDLIYSNNLTIIPNPLEHIVMDMPEICVARLAGYRKTPDNPNEIGAFFVVLNKGVTASEDEITKKIFNVLKSHLTADELAVIQDIYYIDSVPVTTCGKVDRVSLKNLALKKSQIK
ncbi:4-coumarate--CoA ligase 3-like [Lucilia cuprina]|uniref:4-coumarate--CoA ligase 3-like n=1 Tax=Lucilia cuprina TaxID=7375 RepID=UPI001F06C40A|nr:4-coumarate--CoA ligase 3-like [Lucilia cuprina]